MNYPVVRIGDILELKYGKSLPSESRSGVGYKVYGSNGMTGLHEKAITSGPAIIVGRKGSIGEIHYSENRCWPIDTTYYVDSFGDSVVSRWLYYRLQNLNLKALNKAVAIPGLNRNDVYQLEIPLPPLEEQRRIAAILDKGESIQALFDQREKAFRSVEESLFTALREGDNRGLTGKAYSLSDIFWFQEGPGVRNWQFTNSGVKLLNVGNITIDGKIDLRRSERHVSEDEAFGRYSHFLVDEGDLLMPSSGIPIEGDGLLRTRSAFATSSDLPLCMNTSTIRFKPKTEEASLPFLQGWLQSREFRVQITKLVTGSAQKNFGPSHLKQLTITLPHPSLQDDFEKRLTRIRELRHSLHPSESNLSELMFSLGNLAFNGGASA